MSVIATILEEHRQEQEAAEKRRQKQADERTKETLAQANEAVVETLGEVWQEIREANPDAKGTYNTAVDGLVKSLWWEDLKWDGMPPFRIAARAVAERSHYAAKNAETWSGEYTVCLVYPSDVNQRTIFEQCIESEESIAAFFARLDEERKQQETKTLRDELGHLENELVGRTCVETEEEAREAAEKMKALVFEYERLVGPKEQLVEEVNKAFARWQGWRQGQDVRMARVEENVRKLAAYEEALRKWDEGREEVYQRNRERLERLRERFREEITVYDLYYAEVALDHDVGERFVNVRRVNVLQDRPNRDGFWTVLHYGEIIRVRYENVVKVKGPFQKYVGVRIESGHEDMGSITCAPGKEDEARKRVAEVAGQWEETPEQPQPEAFGLQEGAYYDVGGHNDFRIVDYNIRELANSDREPRFAQVPEDMLE